MDPVARLQDAERRTLCAVSRVLQANNIPFAIVGATALLLQDRRFGRVTRDIDLAVVVEGGLSNIRRIVRAHGIEGTDIVHRFRTANGNEIDILGFDPEWTPVHEIPQQGGGIIRAAGLPESVEHAVKIDLGLCRIPVAPLALMIAAKLGKSTIGERRHDSGDALVCRGRTSQVSCRHGGIWR